jgi:hypothetical protein
MYPTRSSAFAWYAQQQMFRHFGNTTPPAGAVNPLVALADSSSAVGTILLEEAMESGDEEGLIAKAETPHFDTRAQRHPAVPNTESHRSWPRNRLSAVS